mmetsp:Transcript_6779/g.13437  ORF Transcript_6779/g.13437 Transcript_6779/m.13437 type:complete len:117 (+) Transcript_6779:942-1292(+)
MYASCKCGLRRENEKKKKSTHTTPAHTQLNKVMLLPRKYKQTVGGCRKSQANGFLSVRFIPCETCFLKRTKTILVPTRTVVIARKWSLPWLGHTGRQRKFSSENICCWHLEVLYAG